MCLCYLGFNGFVKAQILINLPEANITSRSNYTVTLPSGTYTNVLGLIPTVDVKANTTNFASTVMGTTTVPLNVANLTLRSIGAITLLGSSTERTLTMNYQNIYTALASVASGQVTVDYRIATSAHTWIGGIYRAPIQFRTSVLTPNQITPTTPNLDINVPSFITPQATVGTIVLPINSLALYRTLAGGSVTRSITVANTVPYTLNVQATNAQFGFSTTLPYNQIPATSVGLVSATLSGVSNAIAATLSTTSQPITNASGIAVPATNNQTLNAVMSISGDNLKSGFKQAGTYQVPLTFTWNKLNAAYPTGTLQVQRSATLQVVVSDLTEIKANETNVSLSFTTPAHYQQGVSTNAPAHITLSRTIPYNVYVRATSASFTSGSNSIPLDVLRIGPLTGQAGVNTVTLSTTPQQLINTADPAIDRSINLLYSIPASETSKLLGKPAGVYATAVIFSFTAL